MKNAYKIVIIFISFFFINGELHEHRKYLNMQNIINKFTIKMTTITHNT